MNTYMMRTEVLVCTYIKAGSEAKALEQFWENPPYPTIKYEEGETADIQNDPLVYQVED